MFHGEDEHALDEKGRVSIPVKYRELLGEVVFLGRGRDGQINVYPRAVWERMAQRLAEQDQARTAVRNTSRFIFAASDCELDRQGRVLIPAPLRRYGQLDSTVVVLGNNDHLEIWSPQRWEETCARVLADGIGSGEDQEKLAELALDL